MRLDNVSRLLESKFTIKNRSKTGDVKLKEGTAYQFTVTDLPANTKVIKLPSSQQGFFKEGYTKICDYLIFIPKGKENVEVIFCELKSNINEEERCIGEEQMKSTIPLVEYILSGLNVHFGIKWSGKKHFVILAKKEEDDRGDKTGKENIRMIRDRVEYKEESVKVITGIFQLSVSKLYDQST